MQQSYACVNHTFTSRVPKVSWDYSDEAGAHWHTEKGEETGKQTSPAGGRTTGMLEGDGRAHFTPFEIFQQTRLATEVLAGCTLVRGPHEGLVLSGRACAHVLSVLAHADIADPLYTTPDCMEEFVLQNLCAVAGARFAHLGDMADSSLPKSKERAGLPLTKTFRR